ncbi:MAG TPA: trehalose-6-phosphate synthase [Gaiellaceae bacterium]|nr:trehalose-6-phosphate synthase [Gaiellaceae bacterium]
MSSRRKLLVVANRGPLVYDRSPSGERVARRGGGGLVTALGGLVAHHDVTWIASAMSDEDRVVATDNSEPGLHLIAHDPAAYDAYYNVVANPVLWFLQHYMWGLSYAPDFGPALADAWNDGYVAVNEAFAEATIAELEREPSAAVFFHDYHLYLAPRFVRARCPNAITSHFVHIPWPQADYWTVLPERMRREIHEGLLANDVVGFHTRRWGRNFLHACEELLGADVDYDEATVVHAGRRTLVTCHPISIDADEFERLRDDAAVLEQERLLVDSRPELLVLRVDRADPSKNIVRGFRAFKLMLERHPELRGRVRFLALLAPSRLDVPEYAVYLDVVRRETEGVEEIDLRIGDDFVRSVAAYKQYDVLLVNAVFDGLNLVSKEAPLVNERDGVLVLSENTGSHEELGEWALTVNPFDLVGQADALYEALSMAPDERRRRAEAIRAHVREHDLAAWIEAQLEDIDRVGVASSG